MSDLTTTRFELTPEQDAKIDEWWVGHECSKENAGAIGGPMNYTFTPTAIGVVQRVCCGFAGCDAEIDVTEYDLW